MTANFRIARDIEPVTIPFGKLKTLINPALNGAKQLVLLDAAISPGQGHAFHRHPEQEEIIFVVSGQVEQWVDREKKILVSGDSVFIPANTVHASFSVGGEARILAIFGPCVGEGFTTVDVFTEAPWKDLR